VKAAIEGVGYGGFTDKRYRRSQDAISEPMSCELVWPQTCTEDLTESIRHGKSIARSVSLAREFSNDPANILTPNVFAERAVALCKESGLETMVLDETAIRNLDMGLLLGVARGSEEAPRLLVMRYEPPQKSDSTLGLVGKGVTFDSGGISIKPAGGMERMKSDMSGGAAVIGAMCAISEIGASTGVIGLVPMTENMPSGLATKPGDILTSADGTTVEIINTDAEGRLILADALCYAQTLGATHLVDVATLTGACVVALGKVSSGIFGEPAEWVQSITDASERAGERLWPLPLYPEYRDQLESELADLKNVGGREGGASTAAAFLQVFTGGKPWAHLDIAGTAWTEAAGPAADAGATGVMVRTLVELAVSEQAW
jgi:leucyl aminopeptidase